MRRKKCLCKFSSVIKESIGVSSMLLRVLAQIFKNPMNHRHLLIWLFNFLCIVLKADTCKYVH